MCKLIFLLVVFASDCWAAEEAPTVSTSLGQVRGRYRSSFGGRKFSAFEGIPFAKPPVGELRFEEPEPIEPWAGIWNAVTPSECSQGNLYYNKTQGVEDCLHLNVYVPRQNPNPEENLEVLVHIHGGCFMMGRGHRYAKPEFLMDRDFVFVTLNYRLGAFGFLGTEDEVVPGNNGLKDQVLALKWVKDNIASFGGNPDSVTLTGMSAGGVGVHFHYLSPLSKGLFHRGWAQSGVVLNPWSLQEEPLERARLLARALGCPTDASRRLVDCLKQRSAAQILGTLPLFYGYQVMPFAPFAPVIEKGAKNPFLDANPYELLVKGEVHDLPWIASTTNAEGLFPLAYLDNLEEINTKWVELAPLLLDFNYTLPKNKREEIAERIKDFYLGKDEGISKKTYRKLIKMFTDRLYVNGAETAATLQSRAVSSPVYYFRFSYPGETNDSDVIHSAEAQYIFPGAFGKTIKREESLKMKDAFLDMLMSFAKSGKPDFGGNWEPTKSKELTYLEISSYEPKGMKLKTTKELTPRSFWSSLGLKENENFVKVE